MRDCRSMSTRKTTIAIEAELNPDIMAGAWAE
jgi:hypothetical protein